MMGGEKRLLTRTEYKTSDRVSVSISAWKTREVVSQGKCQNVLKKPTAYREDL